MTIYDELVARGLIAQVTDEEEIKELINNGKATFYIGFDPTADSLHVGHFMALCLMKRLQMAGNKPIALIGGGTAMIGDPSGRTDMRQMMTKETINHNCECFKKQMSRFIDFSEGKALMVNNADWLLDHPKISPVFFTSMQCSLLLPFGIVLYVALWLFSGDLKELFGPSPFAFIGWSLFAGVVCSFGATALWNAMSQKVPTAVAGPMLVFETIFSVTWGCVYARAFPIATLFIGMVLLVSGVVYTLMLFNSLNEPVVSEAESSAGGM